MSKHIFNGRAREWHLAQNQIPIETEECPYCKQISLTKEFTPEAGLLQIDCWIEGCDKEWAVILPPKE